MAKSAAGQVLSSVKAATKRSKHLHCAFIFSFTITVKPWSNCLVLTECVGIEINRNASFCFAKRCQTYFLLSTLHPCCSSIRLFFNANSWSGSQRSQRDRQESHWSPIHWKETGKNQLGTGGANWLLAERPELESDLRHDVMKITSEWSSNWKRASSQVLTLFQASPSGVFK